MPGVLTSIQKVEEGLVLEQGCIIEHGTHFDLLSHRSLYRSLLDFQNRIFE